MGDTERSAAATLGRMREGGTRLLMLSRERMAAAQAALDEGRFDDADDRLSEAQSFLAPLVHAERNMARYVDKCSVVAGTDLREGMVVYGYGRIAGDPEEVTHAGRPLLVVPMEGGEAMRFQPDAMVVVEVSE